VNAPSARPSPAVLRRYLFGTTAAALPVAIAATVYLGPRVLAMIAVSCACALASEAAFAVARRRRVGFEFILIGFLLPLTLPLGVPLWMVGAGAAFGTIVGQGIFGGYGHNPFNAVSVGRCFLTLAYPAGMATAFLVTRGAATGAGPVADALSGATPLAAAAAGHLVPIRELLLGGAPGCVGETSRVLLLAGGVALLVTRVASLRIVAGALGTAAALGWLLHLLYPAAFPPVAYQLLSGGLLFGVLFLATDPAPAPAAPSARLAYGCLVGLLALVIRGWGGYPEGIAFALLAANAAAPLLDRAARAFPVGRAARALRSPT